MQMELTTLGQVQLEFEEYKKKVEASSRYIIVLFKYPDQ